MYYIISHAWERGKERGGRREGEGERGKERGGGGEGSSDKRGNRNCTKATGTVVWAYLSLLWTSDKGLDELFWSYVVQSLLSMERRCVCVCVLRNSNEGRC